MPLDELKLNYKYLLDRSIMIFGESKSGKSTIIRQCMYLLKPHIDQVIVISSSDTTSKSYGGVTVPKPCVHKTITDKLLNDVWQRQQALTDAYNRANDINVLKSMFNEISTPANKAMIERLRNHHEKSIQDMRENYTGDDMDTKLEDMAKDATELTIKIYKHFIGQSLDYFANKKNLSKVERTTLQYLNLNPRLLWIFDDCTVQLEKFRKNPIICELFWQGRWLNITAIIATHTDKSFSPELKSGAFLKIFAQESIARAYYTRDSTAMDKSRKNKVMELIDETFTPIKKHQKLVYERETMRYFKYTASIVPDFRFGSPIIWQFCDLIASERDDIQGNKFMSKFE